jgi:hypothetical protein
VFPTLITLLEQSGVRTLYRSARPPAQPRPDGVGTSMPFHVMKGLGNSRLALRSRI